MYIVYDLFYESISIYQEKRKKEIERCLYEVFSKYRVAGDKRH